MKNLNSKLFQKLENNKVSDLNKVIGGAAGTGTCPTDYSSSGGNPDCVTGGCTDVEVTDVQFDTPAGIKLD